MFAFILHGVPRNVVTPLASVLALPVTRPWASWTRTLCALAGASVASVVKSAMVMIRMVDLIVVRSLNAGRGENGFRQKRWRISRADVQTPVDRRVIARRTRHGDQSPRRALPSSGSGATGLSSAGARIIQEWQIRPSRSSTRRISSNAAAMFPLGKRICPKP